MSDEPVRFRCARCDEEHDLADLSLGADAPAPWEALTDAEEAASELTDDQCIIEARGETHFFLRGRLEVPISDTASCFSWGVWVSLSQKSFDEVHEHWEDPARTELGPHFGWLCTAIPGYPDTMYLKTNVHQQPVGNRPTVELEPTDHPLAVHQRAGISAGALADIVFPLLHDE